MAGVQNHLIESLPRAGRKALLAICEPVELVLSDRLGATDVITRYAYFPVGAIISLVTPLDGKPVLEVGMVGREGMVGAELALGVLNSPLHAVVQGPGESWRVPSAKFRRELARSPALRQCMSRYIYVLMAQLGAAAACLRFHPIGPRLARWLLMTQDRAHADVFPMTHEFLAEMLGVRRSTVSEVLQPFQEAGLIRYSRGKCTVLDREALKAGSCECYRRINEEFARLFV